MRKLVWFAVSLLVSNCLAQTASPQGGQSGQGGGAADTKDAAAQAQESKKEQKTEGAAKSDSDTQKNSERGFGQVAKDLLTDQKRIWTSPATLRLTDAEWLVPLGGISTGLFLTDSEFSRHVSANPMTTSHYGTLSNAGVAALAGGAAGLWLLSYPKHNSHWRETGFLAGEAAINTVLMVEALKYPLGRERPFQGDGSGPFFSGGTSFPSLHSAAAWSIAGVVAHEYPGPLPKLAAYGLASFVSFARLRARQHFPSDVFIGGALGEFVGQDVYSRHFDPDLGGQEWRSIRDWFRGDGDYSAENQGSPYVELDSWVYPAIERLAALGHVHAEFLGMRPWTRVECARLIQDAGDEIDANGSASVQAEELRDELAKEFQREIDGLEGSSNLSAQVESLYGGVTGISGTPLNDGYHFGETIINNYGRPYQQGVNSWDGLSAYATAGRLTVYVRAEYQHAPSAAGYSAPVQQWIATTDLTPLQPATSIPSVDRVQVLDAYVAMNAANWNLSFGNQSLWWSPDEGGSLLFSDNATPICMFRVSRVAPFELPWILRFFGPMKLDLFFGQLAGNLYPPRPLIHGEKISFKPTENLELGFARTAEFGGVGRALTAGAILNSYVSFGSSVSYGASDNPGERNGGFEFSYKIPRLRNWLQVYGEAMSRDDPSPLDAPRRSALDLGLYLPRIPGVPRLDLRVEGVNTDSPSSSYGGHFFYWEGFYRDLYTNEGNLIGSWIGREGKGLQAWSTYWFNPKSTLQFGYRHAKVASDFVPGGETVNDGSIRLEWWLHPDLSASAFVQYEKLIAAFLAPTPQTNWTSSVQVTFWPGHWGFREQR